MYTGGLTEFNVLHPSLCEINLPKIKKGLGNTPQQRATTPGTMQALALTLMFELSCYSAGSN